MHVDESGAISIFAGKRGEKVFAQRHGFCVYPSCNFDFCRLERSRWLNLQICNGKNVSNYANLEIKNGSR